jgi:hypothetical protein
MTKEKSLANIANLHNDASPKGLVDFEEKVELLENGWLVKLDEEPIVIFHDPYGIEFGEELGKKLGVSGSQLYAIQQKIIELLSRWHPRSLQEYRMLFPLAVGEDENIETLLLSTFSMKLSNWRDRIGVVLIEGPNSSGKSTIAKTILQPFIEMGLVFEFTSMTPSYLSRRFEGVILEKKIIFYQQAEDLPYQPSLLASEEGLTFGLCEMENGKWIPKDIKIQGHPLIIFTAVHFKRSLDWIHRALILHTDESEQQTRKVISFKSRITQDLDYKERLEAFSKGCRKVFKLIWNRIPDNLEVVIPFIDILEQNIKLKYEDSKIRRDWDRLIGLLRASAIAFYPYRPRVKHNGKEVVVATDEDLKQIYPILLKTFRRSVTGLSEKHEQVLESLKRWNEEAENSNKEAWPTIKDLAIYSNINYNYLRSHLLPDLEREGYIILDDSQRPKKVILKEMPIFELSEKVVNECKKKTEEYLSTHSWSNDQMVDKPSLSLNSGKEPQISDHLPNDHFFKPEIAGKPLNHGEFEAIDHQLPSKENLINDHSTVENPNSSLISEKEAQRNDHFKNDQRSELKTGERSQDQGENTNDHLIRDMEKGELSDEEVERKIVEFLRSCKPFGEAEINSIAKFLNVESERLKKIARRSPDLVFDKHDQTIRFSKQKMRSERKLAEIEKVNRVIEQAIEKYYKKQQAEKEEAIEKKVKVEPPSKSLEAMIEIFKRKAKNL